MKTSLLVDSHAHLSKENVLPQVEDILKRAWESGIHHIVNICTDLPTLEAGLKLSEKFPWIYQAAAVPPHDAHNPQDEYFAAITRAAKQGQLKAIGETGLEYHYEREHKNEQVAWMIKHMQLALACQLPLVIHCREGFSDLIKIIDQEYKGAPGILHCFTGTVEDAQQLVQRNWYISFSGIVTFKKSVELQEAARWVPLEHMLVETDTPYLAPQSHRGKQNEPSFISEVVDFIAKLKGISPEIVAQSTRENALKCFNLF